MKKIYPPSNRERKTREGNCLQSVKPPLFPHFKSKPRGGGGGKVERLFRDSERVKKKGIGRAAIAGQIRIG